jgi:hypothetical protein
MAIPDNVIIAQAIGEPRAAAYRMDGLFLVFVGWIENGAIVGLATEDDTAAMLAATLGKDNPSP